MSMISSPEDRIAALQQKMQLSSQDVKAAAKDSDLPKLAEPALVHPNNTSIVKIRDNGMIEVWTDHDQGIRIDPASKTMNFTAGGFQDHGGWRKSWLEYWWGTISGNWTFNVGGNTTIHTRGETDIHSDGIMRLTSSTHIFMEAPEIDINDQY